LSPAGTFRVSFLVGFVCPCIMLCLWRVLHRLAPRRLRSTCRVAVLDPETSRDHCSCTYHGCKVLCAGFFEPFQPWEQAWLSAGVKMEHPLPCESRLTTKGWRLDGFLFLWFHYLFIWHCCVGNRNNVCCVKSCLTWTNSTSSVRLRQWTHLLSDLGSFPAESWASRRAFG